MTVQETSADAGEGLPIVFAGPMAIVGGGAVDPGLLVELASRGVALVGADGGGDVIGAAGLVPAAIIGDLDSLADRAAWESRTRVVHIAEQLTTDFQKALYSTVAPLTLALGMTGRRFDHTLAALSAVTEYGAKRRILLVDEQDIALALSGPFAFSARPGERISIYPLLPIGFSHSTGLLYPLDGLMMQPGGLIGTSNAAVGTAISIVPAVASASTAWLLIVDKSHLWQLVEAAAMNAG